MTKSELKIKLKEWKNELKENELANKTIKSYLFDINLFIDFVPSDNEEITKTLLINYKENLKDKQHLKESTINRKIISINKFLYWCGFDELKLKKLKTEKKFNTDNIITQKELERILKFAENEKDDLILYGIKTLVFTGVRYSELRFFTVEAVKEGEIKINNKGRIREIKIIDKLKKILLLWAKSRNIKTGLIFQTKNGTFVKNEQFNRRLKKIVGKARGIKLEKAHPHAFRHFFALNYLESTNNNFAKVANVLGHSSLETTRIYLQSDKKAQKDDMEAMSKKLNIL